MNPRHLRSVLPTSLIAATLAFTACGDDADTSTESEAQTVTPETALAEIGETEKGLNEALSTYKSGDDVAAADAVIETYLQHFELVEGPLEKADAELTEELEEMIREQLVQAMEAGEPAADVTALVSEITVDLGAASKALQGG